MGIQRWDLGAYIITRIPLTRRIPSHQKQLQYRYDQGPGSYRSINRSKFGDYSRGSISVKLIYARGRNASTLACTLNSRLLAGGEPVGLSGLCNTIWLSTFGAGAVNWLAQ